MNSLERFRIHLEQAPFSIQLLSPEGQTLAVNQAWRDLWGIPEDIIQNFILKDYRVAYDPQLEAKGIAPLIRRGLSGEIVEIPAILYVPNDTGIKGDPKWVSGFMYPVKDSEGGILEIILTHRDITKTRIAEDELKNAITARDEFISICSHELKTPLTSMKLQFDLAGKMLDENNDKVFSKETVEKRIHMANRQLDRMTRLIDEMLDISRINTGKLQMDLQVLNLKEVVDETLYRFSEQFILHHQDIHIESSSDTYSVKGDRFRLEQVISNLITNSLKYAANKPVFIKLQKNSETVRLEFRDQGIGIAEEDLERIFNRFERINSATNVSGLGLGLYICKQIVDRHQGKIWAESKLGQGTTFVLEVPLAD